MNIEEYAEVISAKLDIRYYQDGRRFHASFEGCEVKEGIFLRSESGLGRTHDDAVVAYAEQIQGQTLVFNATSKALRREFVVPESLTAE